MSTVETRPPVPANDRARLPEGWRWVRLGEIIAEAKPGFACGTREPKGVIQLRMNNVNTRGGLDWSEYIRVPADCETFSQFQLEDGDIVFNNTNSVELVGKSALFHKFSEPVVFSNHFTRLRVVPDRAAPGFLAAWLLSLWQARTFENICNRWIGQSAVKSDKLLALEIPLPPLEEQKRIAAILNEQIAAVAGARAAAQAQLQAAKALPAAYLRAVFSSPEAQQWERTLMGDLCEIIARQVDPKIAEFGQLPHVNGENIESGTCRVLRVQTAAEDGMTSGKYLFEVGDVLYSKLRPYLKKVTVAGFRGLCSADMYPIRVNRALLDPHYTAWMLLSDGFTNYADEESRRARMPKLNRDQLFAWIAPVPPLAEQERIATMLNAQMASAARTRKAIEEELDAVNKLPAAILRRAFAGSI